MKNTHLRTWLFYVVMLLLFGVFTYILFQKSDVFNGLAPVRVHVVENGSGADLFKSSLLHNMAEPASMLLLQIILFLLFPVFSAIYLKKLVNLLLSVKY